MSDEGLLADRDPSSHDLQLAGFRTKRWLTLRVMYGPTIGRAFPCCGALLLLAAMIMPLQCAYIGYRDRRFEREHLTANGIVVKKDKRPESPMRCGGDPRWLRSVSYTFQTAGGQTIQGEAEMREAAWDGLQPGGAIRVHYIPGRPTRNRPDGYSSWQSPTEIAFTTLLVLLLAAACLLPGWDWAREYVSFLKGGRLARGTVLESQTYSERARICYRFHMPDGASTEGVEHVRLSDFGSSLVPGGPVGVLYLPADPSRSILFRERWTKYFRAGSREAVGQWLRDNVGVKPDE